MSRTNDLAKIGLENKKADVYLALLQLGSASVLEISKKSGIKRPTTYDILQDLLNKKLISQSFQGKKKVFTAENPDNLKWMIQEQENIVERILPELRSYFNIAKEKPRVRYYEGTEGIKYICEQ